MRMQNKRIKFYAIAKNLGSAVIIGFLLLISFYLTYQSLIKTGDMSTRGEMLESLVFTKDSIILNIAALTASLALIYLLIRLTKNVPPRIFTAVLLVLTLVLGTVWVLISCTVPTNDSRIVVSAGMNAAKGDLSELGKAYFSKLYPYQTGYVFFTEMISRVMNLEYGIFEPLQIINVLCLAVAYFALLKITDMAFHSERVHKITCILLATALSPVFFTTFMYGNIPGLAFSLVSLWQALLFVEKGKARHAVISATAIALAVTLKLNYMIVLIAEIIIVVLNLTPKIKDLIIKAGYMALAVVLVIGSQGTVKKMYEARSGTEYGNGMPLVAWAAMGVNEAYIEAGWYESAYTVKVFRDSGYDTEKTTEQSLETIKNRLEKFAELPHYGLNFFNRKITSQWNEPTYQSLWTNEVRLSKSGVLPITEFILYDCSEALKDFMGFHQQLVMIGVFAASVSMLKRRSNASVSLSLVILGGFLYHLIFEAKSQYILPYFILMIPLAAFGVVKIFEAISICKKAVAPAKS